MRDRQEEQILAVHRELHARAQLLGVIVRRVTEPGDDALGEAIRAAGADAEPGRGWVTRDLGPLGLAGLWTPGRRSEHALAFVVPAEHGAGAPANTLEAFRLNADDLIACAESEVAMEEYCGYLTQSYENMAMVYRLVRSLGNLTSPRDIVEQSLQHMVETLECDWASALFCDNPGLLGELATVELTACGKADARAVLADARGLVERHEAEGNRVFPPEQNGGVAAVVQPIRLRDRHVGFLVMAGKRDESGDVSSFDTQLMDAVAACISSLLETVKLYEEQAATFMGTLRAFTSSLDAKDPYTRGHSERVALLGRNLALAAGYDADWAERVHMAGTLHDIGKIGVPDAVLCKPAKLTDEEFGLIKRHPRIGHDILRPIPSVRDLLPAVLHHHERWDGRGYPDGLTGEKIPEMARILAVADTFDAMSSNRAYRPARGRDEVLGEIARCAGSQFDPGLVPAFLSMDLRPFDEMLARHASERVDTQAKSIAPNAHGPEGSGADAARPEAA